MPCCVHLSVDVSGTVDVVELVESRVLAAIETALHTVQSPTVDPEISQSKCYVTVDGTLEIRQAKDVSGDRLLLRPRVGVYDYDTTHLITNHYFVRCGESSLILLLAPLIASLGTPLFFLFPTPMGRFVVNCVFAVPVIFSLCTWLTRLNTGVFIHLMRCFEFWYLVGNLVVSEVASLLHVLAVNDVTSMYLIQRLLGFLTFIPLTMLSFASDAMEAPKWVKLTCVIGTAAWYLLQAIQVRLGLVFTETVLINFTVRHISTRAVYGAAVGNISLFAMKFIFTILWKKRDFVMLKADLSRHSMVRSGVMSLSAGIGVEDETVSVHMIELSTTDDTETNVTPSSCVLTHHDGLVIEDTVVSKQRRRRSDPGHGPSMDWQSSGHSERQRREM